MKTKDNIPYNLFAKFFSGEISEKEQNELDAFITGNPENDKIFNDYEKIWSTESSNLKFSNKTEKALDKVKKGIHSETKTIKSSHFKLFYRIAAAIILAIGISYVYYNQYTNKELVFLSAESKNEILKKELADGTIVWLNKNSTLEFPEEFKHDRRIVKLSGEAYFVVQHNQKKPFIVETEFTKTEVLGTEFNLKSNTNDNQIELILTKGKVIFTDEKTKVSKILSVNEKITLDKGNRNLLKTKVNTTNSISWKTNEIDLNGLTLEQIGDDLSTYFEKKIIIEDDIKDIVFHQTLAFKNPNLEDILNTIKYSLILSIDSVEGEIIIKN